MKAFLIAALLLLSSCSMNLAGKQSAPPESCATLGGSICADFCTGQMLASFDGGEGRAMQCCILGDCVKSITPLRTIAMSASLIAADQDCNVYAYQQGSITFLDAELKRKGSYEAGQWVERPSLDVSAFVNDPQAFSVGDGRFVFLQPEKTVILSLKDDVLKAEESQAVLSSRKEGSKWLYSLKGEDLNFYFSNSWPLAMAQGNLQSFFTDSGHAGILRENDGEVEQLGEGYLSWPRSLALSNERLFVLDRLGLVVFDVANGFTFLTSYPLTLTEPKGLATCPGRLLILDGDRIILLSENLKR
jgi:hypothetical protein